MFNPISFLNYVALTATTTMGYGPGQQVPAQLVNCANASGMTLTLPLANSAWPSQPTFTNPTVTPGGGFRMTIFNSGSAGTITVAAAGSDTIVGTVSLTSQNSKVTLQVVPETNTWYVVA